MNNNSPRKILVAYATNAGSTEQAARLIAAELGQDGTPVDVRRVEEVKDLSPYSAAVVGGPMIMGWHRAASRFIRSHRRELRSIPVAYFLTARSLTRLNETEIRGVPISVDPTLAQPPKNPNHLTFRENYSTVKNYIRPALNAGAGLRPVSVAFFNGVLAMSGLKAWQTLFVLLVVQAKPGGEYNEPFIRAWAKRIKPDLSK